MLEDGMNAVYIMANRWGTIYIGVTNDLFSRVFEHKTNFHAGFTWRYQCHKLVYVEQYDDMAQAIAREKELKGWLREKKLRLIRQKNPTWADLARGWYAVDEIRETAYQNQSQRSRK
ncbi:MAG TPA: GIY-YIG nuclease family protein [Candidatus Methylomirabilis sp.]|nr:GIY-YIG nuclease family protein [Candidatus Methylomirabilis sp.]